MKIYLLFLSSILLFSCVEKNEKNSEYTEYIQEIDRLKKELDSNYLAFNKINSDSLISISKRADSKYKKIKSVYVSDTVDSNFEVIMLTVRGQLVKKLKTLKSTETKLNNEYRYSENQYNTLRENLIHETIEKENVIKYCNDEKSAMIILNGEIVDFIRVSDKTKTQYPILFAQMDSIINQYEIIE